VFRIVKLPCTTNKLKDRQIHLSVVPIESINVEDCLTFAQKKIHNHLGVVLFNFIRTFSS